MEDEGEGPVPGQQMQIDGLPAADRGSHADDGKNGGHAGEEGKNAFRPGGAEPANQNLQRGAQ